MQTWVKRATPVKTVGDPTTGGLASLSVHTSEESWIPDSRITVG